MRGLFFLLLCSNVTQAEIVTPHASEKVMGSVSMDSIEKQRGIFTAEVGFGRKANLTIDPKLQAKAEQILKKSKAREGAMVLLGRDGRILAISGIKRTDKGTEVARELALSIWAPAASIFKLVTVSALLESGLPPTHPVCYHGGRRSVVATNLKDNPQKDRHCSDLAHGLIHSQNAIIGKLAAKHLTRSSLARAAKRLGFGRRSTTELPVALGSVELPAKKLEFARVSAGFRKTNISVLSAAGLASIFANKGVYYRPRIIDRVMDEKGRPFETMPGPAHRVVDEDTASQVKSMMTKVVTHGTGRRGFLTKGGVPIIPAGGKTGTLSRYGKDYRQYSWFVGFAPADNPKYSVAVLLANPRKWHMKSHTAARLILSEAIKQK